jgi:hypothetical protein
MKKIVFYIVFLLIGYNTVNAQSTQLNCEALTNIANTWKKSKFIELKGSLVGTNNDMKFSRFKLKTPVTGALSNEVILYTEAPDLNTVEIVMFQEATFSSATSEKFAAIYKSLKLCMKDRTEEVLSGTTAGLVDGDGQLPEVEFDKEGLPIITLVVESPSLSENYYKIVIRIEAPEDDE